MLCIVIISSAASQPQLADLIDLSVDVCRQTFFPIATHTVFIRFSRNLAHVMYVPVCKKKLWNRFSKFWF